MSAMIEIYKVMEKQDAATCCALFQKDKRTVPGAINHDEVNPEYKLSTDLHANFFETQFIQYNSFIYPAVVKGIQNYVNKYHFLEQIEPWEICHYYNIQRYNEGEGYFSPHCEYSSYHPKRHIAWMIYLNDCNEGTEFPYQNMKLRARQGMMAVWPAYWTHPHKGVTPTTSTKFIATGWCQFKE